MRIFKKAASLTVLDAIRSVSDRPGFREFKAIEAHAPGRGALPSVVRAVAIALLDKVNRDNAIVAGNWSARW